MKNPMYMTINGTAQGEITKNAGSAESIGTRYQEGHDDMIHIESYDYGSSIPINKNGFINGGREHNPLAITKFIDSSSPLLFQALNKGETLTEVELTIYRTSYAGEPEKFFTIKLIDAIIANLNVSNNGQMPLETIDFRYRRIELRHELSATSSHDDLRKGPNKS